MHDASFEDLYLLHNEQNGIYIPQLFAIQAADWTGLNPRDVACCAAGPQQEHYWESWDTILNDARRSIAGRTYRLYQFGDLWAIPADLPENHEIFAC